MGAACRGVYFGVSGCPSKRGAPEVGKWRQNAAAKLGECRGEGRRGVAVLLVAFQLLVRHFIGLPNTAFYRVELQCTVDSTPKVVIADRFHAAEPFPLPMMFAPLSELATDSAAHVAAAGQQGYAGWVIQCFEPAYDGQQFEAVAARV